MTTAHRLTALAFHHGGAGAICRTLFRNECTVLAYHGVVAPGPGAADDREGKFVLEPDFIRQLDFIRRHYHPITLERFEAGLAGGSPLPPRALLLTIDDGYRNALLHMAPHMAAREIPGVVFCVTALLDTPRTLWPNRVEMWWSARERGARGRAAPGETGAGGVRPGAHDAGGTERGSSPADLPATMGEMKRRLKDLPPAERDELLRRWVGDQSDEVPPDHPFRMLTWDEARRLETMGVAVVSHTVNHAILARENDADSRRELEESRRVLEEKLGHPVTALAYPNGGRGFFLPRDEELARQAGYRVAFSMLRGRHRAGDNPFAIVRIPVSREEGWLPLFASRLAFPYGLKDRLTGRP